MWRNQDHAEHFLLKGYRHFVMPRLKEVTLITFNLFIDRDL